MKKQDLFDTIASIGLLIWGVIIPLAVVVGVVLVFVFYGCTAPNSTEPVADSVAEEAETEEPAWGDEILQAARGGSKKPIDVDSEDYHDFDPLEEVEAPVEEVE